MALDGLMLNNVITDLNEHLPMRINKIYGINKTDFLIHVRLKKERKVLLISTQATSNRIHFTNRDYTNENEPSNFVMLLRKHLLNGVISEIVQKDYDRYVKIKVDNHNSIGDPVSFHIYLEFLGRFSNMIFCDENDVIFDAVKRISPLENPDAIIIPGATYEIAQSQNKKDPFSDFNYDINDSFVNQYSGFSPLLDKEFRYRIKNGETFMEIIKNISESNKLVITKTNKKPDFHAIALKHLGDVYSEHEIAKGFDSMYFQMALKRQIANETRDLAKFISRELKKQRKKIVRLESQFEKNLDADINLKYGDLIITYQSQIRKGMKFANLIDYENDQPITIELDEKLDAIANAQKYYKKYRKQTNSLKHLSKQIELTNKEVKYFQLLSEQLEFADVNSAKEIKQELLDNKYIFEKKHKHQSKKKMKPDFLTINYDEQTIIRVGKSNIQNDYVTFKASNKNDYWFHVADYHGAHVSVSTDDLSDDVITLCANFAAYYSKARSLKNATVNYTMIKNVKKIPKAPLGMVSIDNFESIYVQIDPLLIHKYIN